MKRNDFRVKIEIVGTTKNNLLFLLNSIKDTVEIVEDKSDGKFYKDGNGFDYDFGDTLDPFEFESLVQIS